jgi:transcriptional regulator of acetoin/glycerol metabolism
MHAGGAVTPAAAAERDAAESSLLSAALRDRICRVLEDTLGNKAAAAKLLGISRRSLYRWLDRLDITA